MRKSHRERILESSVDLFNLYGVQQVTTNFIAKSLNISPGNLYFHFRNKEEILRQLFDEMCAATYAVWEDDSLSFDEFVAESLELFFRYRFFHREMYSLRRKDPELTKLWKKHLDKCLRLWRVKYERWVQQAEVREMEDRDQISALGELFIVTANSFMEFFESPEKPAHRNSLRKGMRSLHLLLKPYRIN